MCIMGALNQLLLPHISNTMLLICVVSKTNLILPNVNTVNYVNFTVKINNSNSDTNER